MARVQPIPHCCWICGNEVDLKTCNIDERGMAVHEDCYFVKVALATESTQLKVASATLWYLMVP